jgi:pimeloyl-ACP methyl ester carboxylesterase
MPLDHFDPANDGTIDVTFAVLPASGESRGGFVTAAGGPGISGILSADSYTLYYDPSITENFDVVFFDPRGIGASGHLSCPEAAVTYHRSGGDVASASGLNAMVEAAETFAQACLAEMGDPDELAYMSTAQVVEDLEIFRQAFGFEEFVIFGESYGTQVGQSYAAAHAENLDRLVIDGVVDLTLDGLSYHQEMAVASSRTLDLTLAACDEDVACSTDLGMEAGAAYDLLVSQLLEGPLTAEFPLPDGDTAVRSFTLADLTVVAFGQLFVESDRMMFLRALAQQVGRGDLVPLVRLLNANLGLDPQTEVVVEDPSWSDAMYYGVECLDYAYPGDTPDEVVQSFIDSGAEIGALRMGFIFYEDLPCAFWPHRTKDPTRPAPLEASGVQVLVLGSTVDPVTPYAQGVDVVDRLEDGYLMSKEGGPHVIFGWGETCPDEEVTAFIVDGTPPVTDTCDGEVISAYEPLFPTAAPDDAETLLAAIESDIAYMPEYFYWDGFTDTSLGCDRGGTMTITASEVGNDFMFERCGLVDGITLDGSGAYDVYSDIFNLDIRIGDCAYAYERSGEDYSVDSQC